MKYFLKHRRLNKKDYFNLSYTQQHNYDLIFTVFLFYPGNIANITESGLVVGRTWIVFGVIRFVEKHVNNFIHVSCIWVEYDQNISPLFYICNTGHGLLLHGRQNTAEHTAEWKLFLFENAMLRFF